MKRLALVIAIFFGTALHLAAQTTLNAASFTGADASVKINACIAAVIAAGGGECDASGLGGAQQMSEQINLGSTAQVAARVGVTLKLPETAVWSWHLTDGVSCGIYQYSSTSLLGNDNGGGGERMVLTASGGSNMDSIYCTDAPSNGANYIRAEGFAVWNNQPGSTFANGVVHIRDLVDQSRLERIFAENYYGDVWHIDGACCGASFHQIQGTSNGARGLPAGKGGIPLTLAKGSLHGIAFYDCGFNAPGPGHPDIFINSGAAFGITFYNLYMEGNGTVDTTSPMIYISHTTGPIHFIGGQANTEQGSLQSTKYVFESYGVKLDVQGFAAVSTTLGINDVTAGTKVPVISFDGALGYIPNY